MEFGERELKRECKGPDVVELQTRLAGFRGTVPDGDFGPASERQVMNFQRDYMKMAVPSGVVDRATMQAIDKFADDFPLDFKALKCPCKKCGGYGQGQFKGRYFAGRPRIEAYHRYEYPGIHRMLLWALRAVFLYLPEHEFVITSGYRCSVDNTNNNRTSTNHHGKAVDIDIVMKPREDKRADMLKCDAARGRIVETGNAQIGWSAPNCKALEPSNIAPTWVHYDVRCYEPKFLKDEAFCTSLKELNNRRPIAF
ncbi:MAG: peptidoglycan-binding protein [Burkholderiales bacterium]|nr:peptidoglycan-binding protein [Burkholderiales bacterium]